MAKNGKGLPVSLKENEPCATGSSCEEMAISGGYCGACYQAYRRLMKQNMAYLNLYLYRVGRYAARGKAVIAEKRGATKTKVA